MNSGYKQFLMLALIVHIPAFAIMAQDTLMSASRIQAAYYKDHAGQERIVAKLLVKVERYEPLSNTEIQFFAVADTSNVLLGKLMTDDKGEAIYILEEDDKAYSDSTGQAAFLISYEGSPTTEESSKDIQVKEADLEVSFFQEDTTKFISIEAFETDISGNAVPIADLEIGLYVKGTFSHLPLVKDVTGADGKLIVPFPVEMPGDTLGNLTIIAKIEDNDVYGNVEAMGLINWAHPVQLTLEARRGLGDTDAPLWMVYTLIVLLSAVWLHYAYVIFLIIKIKLSKHLA